MKSKRDLILTIILLVIMVAIVVVLCLELRALIVAVAENVQDESVVISYVQAYGKRGAFMLTALQALQVITAFFPAQPLQMLAGLCYGTWVGLAISLVGYVVGNSIVFITIRQLDNTFAPYFKRRKKAKVKPTKRIFSVAFLNMLKHPEIVAFILFFVPGLPNGILPYIFARTKLPLWKYLLTICIASVPPVVLCTTVGARFARGDKLSAVICIGVLVVLIALTLIFKNRIFDAIEKRTQKTEDGNGEGEAE